MAMEKISISLSPSVAKSIEDRVDENRSATVNRHLERYFELLRRERKSLRGVLTENECAMLLDASNGVGYFDAFSVGLFWHGVWDAIELERLDEKWNVDADQLKDKVASATYATNCALVDAANRWWSRVANGEQPDYSELLD